MCRPSLRAWLALLPAIASLLAACATNEPSRSLYQWTDADGSVRYTAYPDRIPSAQEHTRRLVVPGASASENADGARVPLASAAPPGAGPVDPLEARIAELEARVQADQETLKALISDPERAGQLRDAPELHEIASRLPALQAELAKLRAQRKAAAGDGS